MQSPTSRPRNLCRSWLVSDLSGLAAATLQFVQLVVVTVDGEDKRSGEKKKAPKREVQILLDI